jgi:hypothetical protein
MNKKILAMSMLVSGVIFMGAGCGQSDNAGVTPTGGQVRISTDGTSGSVEVKTGVSAEQGGAAVNVTQKNTSTTTVNSTVQNQGDTKATKAEVKTETDDAKVDISSEGKVKVQAPGVNVDIGAY